MAEEKAPKNENLAKVEKIIEGEGEQHEKNEKMRLTVEKIIREQERGLEEIKAQKAELSHRNLEVIYENNRLKNEIENLKEKVRSAEILLTTQLGRPEPPPKKTGLTAEPQDISHLAIKLFPGGKNE